MNELAKKHKEKLPQVKENIEKSYNGFRQNYDRYTDFRNFVFVSTQTESERSLLQQLKKPQVEFNILEAYVSRLRGEFSKQEPSVMVTAKDGKSVDAELVKVVEGHLRHILKEANKSGLEYHCYTDTLSGGFSAMKVYTEYTGEMSFHQDIFMRRVFDPTMCGWDLLANKEDKSDGNYCFEIFPKRKKDFEIENPGISLDGITFRRSLGPFNWSYQVQEDDYLLVADYYEKKKVRKTIVMLADGQVMTVEEYKEYVDNWESQGIIAQPPAIVGKPRKTELTKIIRYKLIENQIFDFEETDYKRLPIIFIDGNSILSRDASGSGGSVRQMTRPYVYQARGAQKMKNFAGQTLASEIENMGPSKLIVAKDAIPTQYLDHYVNPQEAILYIYNAFKNDDPNVPLPPPAQMMRPQIPQEISSAFMGADILVQNVLGSFDATMSKITDQQVSGVAIQESATLSNASAMPYVVSFLRGLQSAAQLSVDLIPLYYKTPRTIPVITAEGKKDYVKINQAGGVNFDYDSDAIEINIEAGVSFNVQQNKALQQIIALMNSSPLFAQFINESGLDIILDNVEIRGIDTLRDRAEKWMEQKDQEKSNAKEQPNLEQQALQVAAKQVESESEIGLGKIQLQAAVEQQKAIAKQQEIEIQIKKLEVEMAKILSDQEVAKLKLKIEENKSDSQKVTDIIDSSIKMSKHNNEMREKKYADAQEALKAFSEKMEKVSEPEKGDEAITEVIVGQ